MLKNEITISAKASLDSEIAGVNFACPYVIMRIYYSFCVVFGSGSSFFEEIVVAVP